MSFHLPPYTPPELYVRRAEPDYHNDLDTGASVWFGGGETVSNITTGQREGLGATRIVTAGNSATGGARIIANSNLDWSDKSFRCYVKCDDWSNLAFIGLTIYTNGGFTDYAVINFRNQFSPAMVDSPNGHWVECNFTYSTIENIGTPNFADVTNVIFQVRDNGTPVTVEMDGLSTFELAGADGGLISVTWDDGMQSAFSLGKPIFDKYGWKYSFYPIAPLTQDGTNGHMTIAQLDQLKLEGHEIGMHGQFGFTTLLATSEAELANDLYASRTMNINHGYGTIMAYPLGAFSPATIKEVSKQSSAGMNVNWMHNNPNALSKWNINRFSPSATTTLADITGRIDNAVANNDWLIINLHGIEATPTSVNVSPGLLESVLDYINGTTAKVLPVGNVLRGETLSAIA